MSYKLPNKPVLVNDAVGVRNIKMHKYTSQFNTIIVLLGIIIIALLGGALDPTNPFKQASLLPSVSNTQHEYSPVDYHECVDITHDECDSNCSCDGLGCQFDTRTELPNEYKLIIQDENSFILRQNGREVHVFTRKYAPNKNLFYVVDRDNR